MVTVVILFLNAAVVMLIRFSRWNSATVICRRSSSPFQSQARLAENKGNVEKALYDSFHDIEAAHVENVKEMIIKGDPKAWKTLGSGSCAIVAHLNKGSNVITVSNLGDSRCILGCVRPDSGYLEVCYSAVLLII